jgi:putative phage-type endonuclease
MKIINDIEQRSDEWFALRSKRMTASHAQSIAANGKGLHSYIIQLMSEHYSTAPREVYTNTAIQNGIDLEDDAATVYSFEYNANTQSIAFVIYNEYVGCSPDLFVEDDGLAEIKCPSDKVFFEYILTEKIDTKYMWQMQMQMLVCKKAWCDYIVYNPNFSQSLIVKKVLPDKVMLNKLKQGFETGTKMIKDIEGKISCL